MPVSNKVVLSVSISFLSIFLASGMIGASTNFASATYAESDSGSEESKNRGQRGIVNSESLLKMSKSALQQLLKDYSTIRTYDGFSAKQTKWLIYAIVKDKVEAIRILERLSNISGEKYRTIILTKERDRKKKEWSELEKIISGPKFTKISRVRKGQLEIGGSQPRTELEKEYVMLNEKSGQLFAIWHFIDLWLVKPNVGPGGSVTVNP